MISLFSNIIRKENMFSHFLTMLKCNSVLQGYIYNNSHEREREKELETGAADFFYMEMTLTWRS